MCPIMLEALSIQDYVLITRLDLEFGGGMNVLTGETGAGKSILLGALGLVLGERATSDVVRSGARRSLIEAIFDTGGDQRVAKFLEGAELPPAEEGQLILQREIPASANGKSGKSRARINGQLVPIGTLQELGNLLVDFHGQHQHQSLLRPEEQLMVLDASGAKIPAAAEGYRKARQTWKGTAAQLAALQTDDRERERRLDLLRFELEEIRAAELREGERDELRAERQRLANAESIAERAGDACRLLEEGESGGASSSSGTGALELIAQAENHVAELAEMDEALAPALEQMRGARLTLEELSGSLRSYADDTQADPARLAEVNERLELLDRLRRKYGDTEAEILALAEAHAKELAEAEARDENIDRLEREVGERLKELKAAAEKLSELRTKAAAKLGKAIEKELHYLNMEKARFAVRVETPEENGHGKKAGAIKNKGAGNGAASAQFGLDGADTVEFHLAANPGEPLQPLRKVASGGELSRVMLAIKGIDAQKRRLPTMLFDEIDAGLGGVTAERVGERLEALAERQQLICITHLASIAARGRHHLQVSKASKKGRTETRVERLEGDVRIEEIARMIGGDRATKESLATAKALLS